MAAVVEGEAHLHDVWPENHIRSMVETTSSEDELLSASTMEGKLGTMSQKQMMISRSVTQELSSP
jgi:hypothetical protein